MDEVLIKRDLKMDDMIYDHSADTVNPLHRYICVCFFFPLIGYTPLLTGCLVRNWCVRCGPAFLLRKVANDEGSPAGLYPIMKSFSLGF